MDIPDSLRMALSHALAHMPQKQVTLLEREETMITLGKQQATHARSTTLQQAQWQKVDLLSSWSSPPAELVIASYVLGELEATKHEGFIEKLWSLTSDTLVLIEPGTPTGFSHIRAARQHLIATEAWVVAPCPHALACPMPNNDWCHFAQRVSRTQLHRSVKQVELSYEDEKFSYIAVSRTPAFLSKDAFFVIHKYALAIFNLNSVLPMD